MREGGEHDLAAAADGAAGQPGSGAARDDGGAVGARDPQGLLHLLNALRGDDGQRRRGGAVAGLVCAHGGERGGIRRHRGAERLDQGDDDGRGRLRLFG